MAAPTWKMKWVLATITDKDDIKKSPERDELEAALNANECETIQLITELNAE